MKKTAMALFIMCMCSTFVFSSMIEDANEVKDDLQDRIALGREGGTTRERLQICVCLACSRCNWNRKWKPMFPGMWSPYPYKITGEAHW